MEDSKKGGSSRWLGGAPSAAKNPFRREKSDLSGLKKSVSSSAVTLKKSVSVSSLGKSLRRAASKLSLGSREKSGSSLSVNKVLPIQPVNDDQRSRSTHSVGSLEIGEAVRTRFVWDHGGTIVYVCVMQNGIKKSYRLLKENEGHHAGNATLWAGRCEFRYIVDNVWTHDKDLPAIRNEQGHYNNQVRIKKGMDGIMLIKNPREENLIIAEKKKTNVEIHAEPKKKVAPVASYNLRKCMSGDETLIMSQREDDHLMSMNDTLVLSAEITEVNDSDDEVDEAILSDDEYPGSPPPPAGGSPVFLTEVTPNPIQEVMPDLEVIEPPCQVESVVIKEQQPGLLESHFVYNKEQEEERGAVDEKLTNATPIILLTQPSREDGKVSSAEPLDCTDMSPDAIKTEEVNELQAPPAAAEAAAVDTDGDTKTADFCLHASLGTPGNHALGNSSVEELSAKASDFASEKLDDPVSSSFVVPADDQEMNKSLCMVGDHVTEQYSLGNGPSQVQEEVQTQKTEDLKFGTDSSSEIAKEDQLMLTNDAVKARSSSHHKDVTNCSIHPSETCDNAEEYYLQSQLAAQQIVNEEKNSTKDIEDSFGDSNLQNSLLASTDNTDILKDVNLLSATSLCENDESSEDAVKNDVKKEEQKEDKADQVVRTSAANEVETMSQERDQNTLLEALTEANQVEPKDNQVDNESKRAEHSTETEMIDLKDANEATEVKDQAQDSTIAVNVTEVPESEGVINISQPSATTTVTSSEHKQAESVAEMIESTEKPAQTGSMATETSVESVVQSEVPSAESQTESEIIESLAEVKPTEKPAESEEFDQLEIQAEPQIIQSESAEILAESSESVKVDIQAKVEPIVMNLESDKTESLAQPTSTEIKVETITLSTETPVASKETESHIELPLAESSIESKNIANQAELKPTETPADTQQTESHVESLLAESSIESKNITNQAELKPTETSAESQQTESHVESPLAESSVESKNIEDQTEMKPTEVPAESQQTECHAEISVESKNVESNTEPKTTEKPAESENDELQPPTENSEEPKKTEANTESPSTEIQSKSEKVEVKGELRLTEELAESEEQRKQAEPTQIEIVEEHGHNETKAETVSEEPKEDIVTNTENSAEKISADKTETEELQVIISAEHQTEIQADATTAVQAETRVTESLAETVTSAEKDVAESNVIQTETTETESLIPFDTFDTQTDKKQKPHKSDVNEETIITQSDRLPNQDDEHQGNNQETTNLTVDGQKTNTDASSQEKIENATINNDDGQNAKEEVHDLIDLDFDDDDDHDDGKLDILDEENSLCDDIRPKKLSNVKMGSASTKPTSLPSTPKSPSSKKFITPKHEVVNTTPKKDLFKEINTEVVAIQKSLSRSSINTDLQRSESKSRFLDNVKQRKEQEQIQRKEEARKEREESQMREKEKLIQLERKSSVAPEPKKPINEFDDKPKKLDQIMGPIRDAPVTPMASGVYVDPDFDPGQKDISGINETVKLKKSARKPIKEEPKKERMKFELPAKPAKFPKQKPKEPEKPPKEPTPPPPKEPTPPPKEATPQPPKEPTPPPKSPSPPPLEIAPAPVEEEEVQEVEEEPRISPDKFLPPKIGINGFNGVGRLVLRAALESGLDVRAINDPFVPLNYMVYMLKFDIAHSSHQYHGKEMTVRESPTGQLIINGKAIHVLAEHDVTKIPWELAGVNYVVEATEALNSKAEAALHIRKTTKGVRMKHILEMKDVNYNGNEFGPLSGGCKRVIIAGPSPDAPMTVVGVNDEKIDIKASVISHASAPAAALAPVLSIVQKKFGIKCCSYTLLRSIRGHSKDSMKCANLGPSSHTRSVKWDFSENLVPATMPSLDEELLRICPFLHKKIKGICVYVPTPEVSMLDVTLQLEHDAGDSLYRDVCLALKEAASEPPLKTVMRYCMKMSNDNSASSLFASETHSSIIDGKSGCQINEDTIKLIIWFDNESGHAYRIIDLITNFHLDYCQESEENQ